MSRKCTYHERIRRLIENKQQHLPGSPVIFHHEDKAEKDPCPPGEVQGSMFFKDLLRRSLQPRKFDPDDLNKSISREFLRPFQKSELVNKLYRSSGQVTNELIVRMGSFLGVTVDCSILPHYHRGNDSSAIGDSKRSESPDSEPDPEEPVAQKPAKGIEQPQLSPEKMFEIVLLLKKELNAMYRDLLKNEEELAAAVSSSSSVDNLPSYKQKPRDIAPSLTDFKRMTKAKLFGTKEMVLKRPASQASLMLSQMSLGVTDETASTASTSHLTLVDENEQREILGHHRSISSIRSRGSPEPNTYHPQKNPDVFRLFYPSVVPEESLSLPIFSQMPQILSMLRTRQVVVISGMTGTGKSTQVPLMVLDECAKHNRPCNIIVTQPRKLAAVGIARRVCQERKWNLGQIVGYHIGLDRVTSESTRLTYCTTGVFVEKIVSAKHLNAYTHVFLDEVHERDQETDLALMLVRQMLKENSENVQVILMSATVEVNKMVDYFAEHTNSLSASDLPGRVNIAIPSHDVYEMFLEDFAETPDLFEFDMDRPRLSRDLLSLAVRTLDCLTPVSDGISSGKTMTPTAGSAFQAVLVFLPGLEYIQDMSDLILATPPASGIPVEVMILHSTISKVDQTKVLDPPATGVRRIILSTNIAESSVTIPYIDYVFDFCLTKVLRLNPRTKTPQLSLEWASAANSEQRKGRVGRVRKGRVYFFVPRKFMEKSMLRHPVPEILVAPMEHSVLRIKCLGVASPPAEIMVLLPDPPRRNDVELTILKLKEAGALTVNFDGSPSYADGHLTLMGQMLAWLPMDVGVAKFLILCAMFGCVQEGVTIAAGLTVEFVISTVNSRSPERCKLLHELYSKGVKSDPLAILYAFEAWNTAANGKGFRNFTEERRWCQSNLIDLSRMKELVALKKEIWHRLTVRGLANVVPPKSKCSSETLIPLLLAGAFYPNILVNSVSIDDILMGKDLVGFDPLRTCSIGHFGHSTIAQAPLYEDELQAMFRKNFLEMPPKLVYGPRDTYICFPRIPGTGATTVHPGVEFLKRTMHCCRDVLQFQEHARLDKMPELVSQCFGNFVVENRFCIGQNSVKIPPPSLILPNGQKSLVVLADITNIERFWLGMWDASAQNEQLDLERMLHTSAKENRLERVVATDVRIGSCYVSRHGDNKTQFARVIVLSKPDHEKKISVLVADTGVYDKVPVSWLCLLPVEASRIPKECFEFSFSGLRFTPLQKPQALRYIEMVVGKGNVELTLEVYSVLDGVVRGNLHWTSTVVGGAVIDLKEELIKLGYAYVGPESWISEFDHKRYLDGNLDSFPSVETITEQSVPDTDLLPTSISVGPVRFPSYVRMNHIDRKKMHVTIDVGSLNGFTCEAFPQDRGWPYRPIIAAWLEHPGIREDRLKAYMTTELPTHPGLLGILALVFSPKAEVQITEDKYTGVLTGLGPLPDKPHSFYPDGEVEIGFDGEVTPDDILAVDLLRLKMNEVLKKISSDPSVQESLEELQNCCVNTLLRLVEKPRASMPQKPGWKRYEWKTRSTMTDMSYAAHVAAEMTFLVPVHADHLRNKGDDFFQNAVALHRIIEQRLSDTPESSFGCCKNFIGTRCLMCNVQLPDLDSFLAHLYSAAHIVREKAVFKL